MIRISRIKGACFQIPFFHSFDTGRGILTITYSQANSEYAVISNFNVWDFVVNTEEIIYMSYGCSERFGNAISWLAVRHEVNGNITLHSPAICREHTGEDN